MPACAAGSPRHESVTLAACSLAPEKNGDTGMQTLRGGIPARTATIRVQLTAEHAPLHLLHRYNPNPSKVVQRVRKLGTE
jgi:hypothetical protein